MPLELYDTHAHLTDGAYQTDLPRVLGDAKAAGVVAINVIGFDAQSSLAACQLAAAHAGYLHAAVGIQPHSAGGAGADDWSVIERLAMHPQVKALGETGLDCYWDDTPLEIQRDYFERHIALATATAQPLVIHMRDSGREIVDQLRPHAASGTLRGVMHSFTGDWQICRQCLDMGLMISFAGMVTFKNSGQLREVASKVPLDRLLVETDCPYLSPEPLRGRRPNEPARVEYTLRSIAHARGHDPEVLATQTTLNAKRLFAVA